MSSSITPTSLFVAGLVTGIAAAVGVISVLGVKPKTSRKQFELSNLLSPVSSPSLLTRLEAEFTVSSKTLAAIVKHFVLELQRGLEKDGRMLKQIPSFVTKLPKGNETGTYLALDLGGSNFRVCEVILEGSGRSRVRSSKHTIPESIKKGTGEQLFDFLADCIKQFIDEHKIRNTQKKPLLLGFTFSFPINQTALNSGTLMYWNKGFTCTNVEGQDVVDLLQTALKKKHLHITVTALVNDTVGTLMAHSYIDPQTSIAVILGTGTNAAYVENLANVPKWTGEKSGKMIINTEWGNFDAQRLVLPVTTYDVTIDRATSNPGIQQYEKMISGLYLGEIVRLILIDLMKSGEIFPVPSTVSQDSLLYTPYGFETAFMSRVERDHSSELSDVKSLLDGTIGVKNSTFDDRKVLKRVCELVGLRAARLSAAGIASLVTLTNALTSTTVAIDGSVFEHYPHFKDRMRDALRELLGLSEENIVIDLARDGSSVGAALVAAVEGSQ